MKVQSKQDERIATMTFSSVYPHYITKITKKERTIEELHKVIEWFTGMNEAEIQKVISNQLTFKDFFDQCSLNENAILIKGSICGYKIEEIENSLTKKVRMLDKLVDELARKIFRENFTIIFMKHLEHSKWTVVKKLKNGAYEVLINKKAQKVEMLACAKKLESKFQRFTRQFQVD